MNDEIFFNETVYGDNVQLTGLFFLFFIGIMIFALISYVITAISIYKMAKNLEIEWAYAAWIPIANSALMVKIVQDKIHPSIREYAVPLYVGLLLANLVLSFLAPLLLVASFYVMFLIFKQYSENYVK